MRKHLHDRLIFWLGLGGVAFYAVGPLVFPKVVLREPELLPVYTAMMGLGSLRKKGDKNDED